LHHILHSCHSTPWWKHPSLTSTPTQHSKSKNEAFKCKWMLHCAKQVVLTVFFHSLHFHGIAAAVKHCDVVGPFSIILMLCPVMMPPHLRQSLKSTVVFHWISVIPGRRRYSRDTIAASACLEPSFLSQYLPWFEKVIYTTVELIPTCTWWPLHLPYFAFTKK
jgi:hypothetical protein